MAAINFTSEHKQQLEKLMLKMLFDDASIKGAMGTTLNVVQLLHQTSIKTLQNLFISVSKEIENQSKLDRWSMTDYQQSKLEELKVTSELLDLLIGFKKSEALRISNAEIIREKKRLLKDLIEEKKTPAERIAELEAEIAAAEA